MVGDQRSNIRRNRLSTDSEILRSSGSVIKGHSHASPSNLRITHRSDVIFAKNFVRIIPKRTETVTFVEVVNSRNPRSGSQ